MTPIRLARNELLRFTSGRLPKLALAALLIVPLLYGAMYIYANWDPYSRLGNIPVALVNADTGAKEPGGKRINAGDIVTDQLRNSDTFDWEPTDAASAARGVSDGTYTFSLTLPAGFSASLVSPADFNPRQGRLLLATNDANNYLVRTIADKVVGEVRNTVAKKVGTKAAQRLLSGVAAVHDQLSKAERAANTLAGGARKLNSGNADLLTGARTAANGADELAGGLASARQQTQDLPGQTATLASGAQQVADGNATIAAAGKQVAGASSDLLGKLDGLSSGLADRLRDDGFTDDQISKVTSAVSQLRGPVDDANSKVQSASDKLDSLSSGANQVAAGAQRLADAAPALSSGVANAAAGANKLKSGLDSLRDGEQRAANGSRQLAGGAGKLHDGLAAGLQDVPNPNADARNAAARTIGDPVSVRNTGEANAPTYGAGLAPFFLGLAAWIGGFVLFLLFRPLSSRALHAGRAPVVTALGGLLGPVAAGLAQMVILYAVVTLLVGVHPEHPILTLGFLLVSSVAFVALLHGLNALLGPVGKFLGLVLLILQLVSAGGTFPWQTIPEVLYPLHVLLPMSYVVDGLRHLLYGGSLGGVLTDVVVLLAWLVIGFGLATFAAARQRMWTPARLRPELVL